MHTSDFTFTQSSNDKGSMDEQAQIIAKSIYQGVNCTQSSSPPSNKANLTISIVWDIKEAPIYFSNIFISLLDLVYFTPLGCPPLKFKFVLAFSTMRNRPKTKHTNFRFCGVICTEAIKVRPQWTTNWLRFHK